eukprot:1215761-Rhodomonas_salina.2
MVKSAASSRLVAGVEGHNRHTVMIASVNKGSGPSNRRHFSDNDGMMLAGLAPGGASQQDHGASSATAALPREHRTQTSVFHSQASLSSF